MYDEFIKGQSADIVDIFLSQLDSSELYDLVLALDSEMLQYLYDKVSESSQEKLKTAVKAFEDGTADYEEETVVEVVEETTKVAEVTYSEDNSDEDDYSLEKLLSSGELTRVNNLSGEIIWGNGIKVKVTK